MFEMPFKICVGDMWELGDQDTYRCITTNGVVGTSGLIMGKGIALQAKERFPEAPQRIGSLVSNFGNNAYRIEEWKLITWPTKHHWRNPSDMKLVTDGANRIVSLADHFKIKSIVFPPPGCGNGGLDIVHVVHHLYYILDDRFTMAVSQEQFDLIARKA